jgi:hypothetical protein
MGRPNMKFIGDGDHGYPNIRRLVGRVSNRPTKRASVSFGMRGGDHGVDGSLPARTGLRARSDPENSPLWRNGSTAAEYSVTRVFDGGGAAWAHFRRSRQRKKVRLENRNVARPGAPLATRSASRFHSPVRAYAHRPPARWIRLAARDQAMASASLSANR